MRKVGNVEAQKAANVFHDWYTNRWNEDYADCSEPGWAITNDVVALLRILVPTLTAKRLKVAIAKVQN